MSFMLCCVCISVIAYVHTKQDVTLWTSHNHIAERTLLTRMDARRQ
jgi:hypothetical protein